MFRKRSLLIKLDETPGKHIFLGQPIFNQCSTYIPPKTFENLWFSAVFSDSRREAPIENWSASTLKLIF